MGTPNQQLVQPIMDWSQRVVGTPLHWLYQLDQNPQLAHLVSLLQQQGPAMPHPFIAARQEIGRLTPEAAEKIRQLVSAITGGK